MTGLPYPRTSRGPTFPPSLELTDELQGQEQENSYCAQVEEIMEVEMENGDGEGDHEMEIMKEIEVVNTDQRRRNGRYHCENSSGPE